MITKFEIKNEPDIVLYSKIIYTTGNRPLRIVVRKLESDPVKYVTHIETLGLVVVGDTGTWTHESYCHGNYFGGYPGAKEEFVRQAALDDFGRRIKNI